MLSEAVANTRPAVLRCKPASSRHGCSNDSDRHVSVADGSAHSPIDCNMLGSVHIPQEHPASAGWATRERPLRRDGQRDRPQSRHGISTHTYVFRSVRRSIDNLFALDRRQTMTVLLVSMEECGMQMAELQIRYFLVKECFQKKSMPAEVRSEVAQS